MKEETIKLNLRLPRSVHEDLVRQAKDNRTSLNTHILNQIVENAALRAELREKIPQRLRGVIRLLLTAMDVAAGSRMFFDRLYAEDRGPDWLDVPDGYEAAAGAAGRVLDALKPKRPDTSAGDAAALARANRSHGQAVAQRILNRVATGEPSTSPSAWRTEFLREHLGRLVERIEPTDEASGFEPVEVAPMTAERKTRVQEARSQEANDEDNN
jgi:hypothetical protein